MATTWAKKVFGRFFTATIWWNTVSWPKLHLRNFELVEGGRQWTPPHLQSPLQRWWWRGMVFQWSRHHLIFFHSSFFNLAGEETHLLLLLQKLFLGSCVWLYSDRRRAPLLQITLSFLFKASSLVSRVKSEWEGEDHSQLACQRPTKSMQLMPRRSPLAW